MIRAHAAALIARLSSDAALTVYDGQVPELPALPYVVLWTWAPRRSSDRMTRQQLNARQVFQTTSVGATPEQVRAVQEHVYALLVDYRLAVAGRNTTGVAHEASQAISRDDDVTPPLFVGIDQWSVFSTPA